MKKSIRIAHEGTADDCILEFVNSEEAIWENDGDFDRKVVFVSGRTPFASDSYIIKAHSIQESGPITTTEKGKFPYDIHKADAPNDPAADPHIIIK